MRAIQIDRYGGVDALIPRDIAIPAPEAGTVRVDLAVAGLNFIDVYMREGKYRDSRTYGTPLPFTLGMEGAGVVADANGSTRFRQGDRVAWCLSRGSYAESAWVPDWKLVKLPDNIDFETGATLMLQGCTAHYLCHSAAPLEAGDWCLVHAGAGGVGQILIQLAVNRGARVITTVGSREKADIATSLGAEHAILYRDADFLEAVTAITGGHGVSVVYDSVGRDTIERSIRCLRRRGTIVNYGGASGLVASVSPLALAEAGSVFFTRPHLAHYLADHDEITWRTGELFRSIGDGTVKIHIDQRFPLDRVADAMTYLEARKSRGKVLLEIA